jgi:hypothetical protein
MGKVVKLNTGDGAAQTPQAEARKTEPEKQGPASGGASALSGLDPKLLYIGGGVVAVAVLAGGLFLAMSGNGGGADSATYAPGGSSAAAPAMPSGTGATDTGGMPSGAAPAPPSGEMPVVAAPVSGAPAAAVSPPNSDMPPGMNLSGAATGQTQVTGVQSGGAAGGAGGAVGGGVGGGPNTAGVVDSQGKINYDELSRRGLDSGEVAKPSGFPTGPGMR